jgi:hypothetical protein
MRPGSEPDDLKPVPLSLQNRFTRLHCKTPAKGGFAAVLISYSENTRIGRQAVVQK